MNVSVARSTGADAAASQPSGRSTLIQCKVAAMAADEFPGFLVPQVSVSISIGQAEKRIQIFDKPITYRAVLDRVMQDAGKLDDKWRVNEPRFRFGPIQHAMLGGQVSSPRQINNTDPRSRPCPYRPVRTGAWRPPRDLPDRCSLSRTGASQAHPCHPQTRLGSTRCRSPHACSQSGSSSLGPCQQCYAYR